MKSSPQDSIGPTKNECAVIMAIVSLLSYLYDYDMKPLSEVHLISSYTHSFMHSLLSAKKPAKVAHCSNVVPEEFDDTIDRPDYKIDVYASSGHRFSYTNAYGEVKKCSNVSPALLTQDFYRLCIFLTATEKSVLDTLTDPSPKLTLFTVSRCTVDS